MRGWLILFGILVAGGLIACAWPDVQDVPAVLLAPFGWIRFLHSTLPRVSVDAPGLLVGGLALLGLVIGQHLLLRSLTRPPAKQDDESAAPLPASTWRLRWTLSLLGVVLLMFVAGIAMVGLVHHVVWLATADEPMHVEVMDGYGRAVNNRKVIAIAVQNFSAFEERFPGESDKNFMGARHSWATLIAPFVPISVVELEEGKPWDDPAHLALFRRLYPDLLHPSYPKATWRDADGLGLSHYAANQHVIGPRPSLRPDEITDGVSSTMLIGEVNSEFHPWGKPGNCRDPAKGLNRASDGFGGLPGSKVVHFVFADGSVHALRADTDPDVLRALATPAGNDGDRVRDLPR